MNRGHFASSLSAVHTGVILATIEGDVLHCGICHAAFQTTQNSEITQPPTRQSRMECRSNWELLLVNFMMKQLPDIRQHWQHYGEGVGCRISIGLVNRMI